MTTGLFANRAPTAQGIGARAHQRRLRPGRKPDLARIHRFDDLIAEGMTPEAAAITMGLSAAYGRGMLSKIRAEINEAQRRAGYGDWAV